MSRRFEDVDLARLGGVPDLVPVNYEADVDAIRAGFSIRWEQLRTSNPDLPPVDTLLLESEMVTPLIEEVAYRVSLLKQQYNDSIRAVMLASTWGPYLEHRAAEFGLTRRIVDLGNPQAGIPATYETDEELRRRRQMAIEAISTAGPYGAYIWWAQEAHPQVKGVAVYGPESGLVSPGEVLVVVLDKRGNGTPDAQVLGSVQAALSPKSVRPLTEAQVMVEAAQIASYSSALTIKVLPGPDIGLIQERSLVRARNYALDRHRVGASVSVAGFEAAGMVLSEDGKPLVEEIKATLTYQGNPVAQIPSAAKRAPYATAVTVTAEIIND